MVFGHLRIGDIWIERVNLEGIALSNQVEIKHPQAPVVCQLFLRHEGTWHEDTVQVGPRQKAIKHKVYAKVEHSQFQKNNLAQLICSEDQLVN